MADRRALLWHVARLCIAVVLVAWLSTSGAIRWDAMTRLAEEWPLTLGLLALFLADFAVTSYRVCVLLRPRGFAVSTSDAMRLGLVSNLFAMVLPAAGGDVARVFYAARDATGRRFEVATLLLVDRVLGLLGMLLLPLLAAPFFSPLVQSSSLLRLLLAVAAAASLAIAAGMAVAISRRGRNSPPMRWALRTFPLGGYPTRVVDAVHALRGHGGALWMSLALSLVAHLLSCVIIMTLAAITAAGPVRVEAGFLAGIGFVANSVPLTPGGLGVGEAAFESLFGIAGIGGGAVAMIAWRLFLLALVPAGLVVYLGGRRQFLKAGEAA